MSSLCTQPSITEEDEKRELAGLTSDERHGILDDVFGRNTEATETLNRRVISQGEIRSFYDHVSKVPVHERSAIILASIHSPEIIENETSPTLFIRSESYNLEKAAKRFVRYWEARLDLFGEERAFLPMKLGRGGAFEDDHEVLEVMKNYPMFRTFLPNDDVGRTVLYCDVTASDTDGSFFNYHRVARVKYVWYNIHQALRKQSAKLLGLVCLIVRGQYCNLNLFDHIAEKMVLKTAIDCFPVKIRSAHVFYPRNSLFRLIFQIQKFFLNKEVRYRIIHHPQNLPTTQQSGGNISGDRQTSLTEDQRKAAVLDALKPYGFDPKNLPPILGGTYEVDDNWVQHELELNG
eukprot:CAMPEP_0195281158 /NCGR_PEP_ID=MMETSP0707-20130614/591_1 /TAXON_ID=33640 /ORGANISM="Asterionellopsis glacialis, Strain CCMP134" /LENGTH=347 /DNA_ID=CAMNT_0040340017 /DNA_START=160 /DNA_END=1203 /DNA_ORIENTATION=+